MRLQHIISTMHQTDFSVLEPMNCKCDMLVVNQTDEEKTEQTVLSGCSAKMIYTTERGLSNSRNMLLENADGDVVLIGDDDLVYVEGYEKIIAEAHEKYPEADIIAFNFTESEFENTRKHAVEPTYLNLFSISKTSSVEITIKLERVKEKNISFDTLLGLGARFGSGEENAFLADCLRAGLKILYIPQVICYIPPMPEERVKWQDGFNEDYFVKKGACFHRIYKNKFLLFSAAFILLKKRNIFKNVPVLKAISWMIRGKKEYKKTAKE